MTTKKSLWQLVVKLERGWNVVSKTEAPVTRVVPPPPTAVSLSAAFPFLLLSFPRSVFQTAGTTFYTLQFLHETGQKQEMPVPNSTELSPEGRFFRLTFEKTRRKPVKL